MVNRTGKESNAVWLNTIQDDVGICKMRPYHRHYRHQINGLVQERCNSSALTMELRLSCTNASIYMIGTGGCNALLAMIETMAISIITIDKYSVIPLKSSQLSPNSPQNTSHSSPVRVRYGMYFVSLNCDLYPASVTE